MFHIEVFRGKCGGNYRFAEKIFRQNINGIFWEAGRRAHPQPPSQTQRSHVASWERTRTVSLRKSAFFA